MALFQKADRPGYDGSLLRIYRLAFWRWWKIWGKYLKPPHPWQRQVHSEAAELDYMSQHPEIWLPGEDYSEVYAEHPLEPINAGDWYWEKGKVVPGRRPSDDKQ